MIGAEFFVKDRLLKIRYGNVHQWWRGRYGYLNKHGRSLVVLGWMISWEYPKPKKRGTK